MKLSIAPKISPSWALLAGLVLVAPPALFILANVLNEAGIGFLDALVKPLSVFGPVMFLGGPVVALVLNGLAVGRLECQWDERELVCSLAVAPRIFNLVLIFAGGLTLAVLAAYGFVENYRIIDTHLG